MVDGRAEIKSIALCRLSPLLGYGYGIGVLGPGYDELGRKLALQKDPDRAIKALQIAVKLDRTNARTWYTLAKTYRTVQKSDDAYLAIHQALKREPAQSDYWIEYLNIGSIYQTENNLEKSLDIYKNVAQVLPDLSTAHLNLGILYFRQGSYPESAVAFQAVTQIDPKDSEAYLGLAQAYEKMGQVKKAVASYRKTLSINPKSLEARDNLRALQGTPK